MKQLHDALEHADGSPALAEVLARVAGQAGIVGATLQQLSRDLAALEDVSLVMHGKACSGSAEEQQIATELSRHVVELRMAVGGLEEAPIENRLALGFDSGQAFDGPSEQPAVQP